MIRSPRGRPGPLRRSRAAIAAGAVLLASLVLFSSAEAARGRRGIREQNLDERYRIGDWAFFVGWHDPWDWQFDEQGSFAWPLGMKFRMMWPHGLRGEVDLAYYRTGSPPRTSINSLTIPEFDGLMLATTLQWTTPRRGPLRPYVGGGPVFVSLTNNYPVVRTDIRDAQPFNIDQRTMARWNQFDVGLQLVVGADILPTLRAFPFIEYRHLFGELTLDDSDVKIGSFSLPSLNSELTVEDLETLPEGEEAGATGRKYSSRYDWSGPMVLVGLKIRF